MTPLPTPSPHSSHDPHPPESTYHPPAKPSMGRFLIQTLREMRTPPPEAYPLIALVLGIHVTGVVLGVHKWRTDPHIRHHNPERAKAMSPYGYTTDGYPQSNVPRVPLWVLTPREMKTPGVRGDMDDMQNGSSSPPSSSSSSSSSDRVGGDSQRAD